VVSTTPRTCLGAHEVTAQIGEGGLGNMKEDRMKTRRMAFLAAACATALVTVTSPLAQQGPAPATPNIFHLPYNPAAVPKGPVRMYNTAKAKLMAGGKIVGITVYSPDPNMYCAMANAGYDFTWIEMQHSPLTYEDVARMLYACKGSTAMPFIRVPDATEENIQKATDIGAVGIIVPQTETVEKAQAAAKWSHYPPLGQRSQGSGQYNYLWGSDYRQTYNDNVLLVVMIEAPFGAEVADKIAAVKGVDVVFAASGDMGSYSGYKQGDEQYESLIGAVRDATLKAGKKLGGPSGWYNTRANQGYSFFQAGGETSLIAAGARAELATMAGAGVLPPGGRGARGATPAVIP
jgi:2-keto-3-deoxy-L-rhamnonate aldolase RhmA